MKYLLGLVLLFSPFINANEQPINGFGNYYNVPKHDKINDATVFKIAFDVADGAKKGEQNNSINSLARFINMHVAHGGDRAHHPSRKMVGRMIAIGAVNRQPGYRAGSLKRRSSPQ